MDPIWDLSLSEAFTHPATIHILSNNQPIWLQPQPQLDATVPLNRKRNKARKYPEEDWEAQKQEITRLYEKNTLDSIMKLMKERHGFDPSPKQYKDHIKKWGLNKNVQTHEMEAIIKMQNNRLLESGKQSAFRVRKRPVPPGKISRYIKEHRKEIILDNESNVGGSKSPAATPGAISCYTPSETGPVTPHAAPCPLASLSPQPSFSHQGPHSSSYQFGDPGPILPSSSWVAQITGGSHMQHSSPIPIAASPTASSSALVEVEESTFTGQSPAPFSVPSTPQAYNHDLLQDEAMEVNTLAIMWNTACLYN
ncbi:hypothetical protein DL98DRAFT_596999 [Cadophora sp. DSE1049]|nr:hypothetical protein DL98DRAFT_596999 [Cadophora sp. DSE1049]